MTFFRCAKTIMAQHINLPTSPRLIIPLHSNEMPIQHMTDPITIKIMAPFCTPYKFTLTPTQLTWAISISKPLGDYADASRPQIHRVVVIDVPPWVRLTASKAGTLIASMAGATIDVDIMRNIEITEILKFYMWMSGNNYFAHWASTSPLKGHYLLAELINIFGMYHPASMELTVWLANEYGSSFETLQRVMAGRFQDSVSDGDVFWDVLFAGYIDRQDK